MKDTTGSDVKEWIRENGVMVVVALLVGFLVFGFASRGDIERWEDEEAGIVCYEADSGLSCLPYSDTTLRYNR